MNIFQTQLTKKLYRAVIVSEQPIFANYYDLIDFCIDDNIGAVDLHYILDHQDCPRSINQRSSYAEGIWVCDQIIPFIDKISRNK